MPEFRETVELPDVSVKAETDKAILCVIEEEEEYWIPQLIISEWLAQQKGLVP